MIDEELMFKLEQEKQLEIVRGDIERALHSVKSAIHYLQETGDYESDLLDNVTDELFNIDALLTGLLGPNND